MWKRIIAYISKHADLDWDQDATDGEISVINAYIKEREQENDTN
jgi:hypothetical protein